MPFLLSFVTSKLGGWAAAALIFVVMSGVVYAQGLRLDAKNGIIRGYQGELAAAAANLQQVVAANARYKELLDRVTQDMAAAELRGKQAAAMAAQRTRQLQATNNQLLEEIRRAASPDDDRPVGPAIRAALDGLRRTYGTSGPDR